MAAENSADSPWIEPEGVAGLVSIIIPTCNRAVILTETIESVFAQDYRPIEIVVVDDASQDNTEAVVLDLQTRQPDEIQLYFLQQDKAGAPVARNRGAAQASGEFIVFMDDDDVFTPAFLSAHFAAYHQNPAANLSFGRWQRFLSDQHGFRLLEKKGELPAECEAPWEGFLLNWELLLQSCLIRRSLVQKVGPWRTDLKKSQDLDYKARLLAADPQTIFAANAAVYYRLHEKSITGQLDAEKVKSYEDVLLVIEQLAVGRQDYQTLQAKLADYFWNHAQWLYSHGEMSAATRTLRLAHKHDGAVSQRNGLKAGRIMARLGLSFATGPILYCLFRLKTAVFGKKARKVSPSVAVLPSRLD